MFSFVRRWLGKGGSNEKEEGLKEETPKDAPTPYSMDFSEASEIVISARDCTRKNVEAVIHRVVRPNEIEEIAARLADLPREGEVEKEMDPCTEHTLTAYKGDQAFATVTFYKGHLKLEDGKFMVNDEKMLKKQAELFELIKIQ